MKIEIEFLIYSNKYFHSRGPYIYKPFVVYIKIVICQTTKIIRSEWHPGLILNKLPYICEVESVFRFFVCEPP